MVASGSAAVGKTWAQSLGAFGQESFAQGQGNARQLAVNGLVGVLKDAVFLSAVEGLSSTAMVLNEGVLDQLDDKGEGQISGILSPTQTLEQIVEVPVVSNPGPQLESRLGQRQPLQNGTVKSFCHGPYPKEKEVEATYFL